VSVINDYQDRIFGHATIDEEFLGDAPQLIRRASDIPESELSQKREVELFLAITSFIDGRITDFIVEAGNVTVQQCGFSRSLGTANDDQAIGLFRRDRQMGRQQRILFGMKDFGRSRQARKWSPREPEEFEIGWIRSRAL
jgi:hypothetical protein